MNEIISSIFVGNIICKYISNVYKSKTLHIALLRKYYNHIIFFSTDASFQFNILIHELHVNKLGKYNKSSLRLQYKFHFNPKNSL